jgi:hypothetical protein
VTVQTNPLNNAMKVSGHGSRRHRVTNLF